MHACKSRRERLRFAAAEMFAAEATDTQVAAMLEQGPAAHGWDDNQRWTLWPGSPS